VIGGAGLLALGVIDRPTRDIDVVALRGPEGLEPADPLPAALVAASDRVAQVLGLAPDWLNAGPAALLGLGREELLAAARWSRTHDPSDGYRLSLIEALGYLDVKDADGLV